MYPDKRYLVLTVIEGIIEYIKKNTSSYHRTTLKIHNPIYQSNLGKFKNLNRDTN